MNDTPFYAHWFAGVNRFLDSADGSSREAFIESCAESCSASYSRGVYERAFSGGRDLAGGLEELKRNFADFDYTLNGDEIEIRFARCGCDLVNDGRMSSPMLCDCSVASCRKNWETIYGEGSVRVELKESVLKGDGRCVLAVKLLDPALRKR